MAIDRTKVIAVMGVAGYGPDWRKQPGRLGFGVGTDGYGPLVERFLLPLVQETGCRRILMHKMWADAGEKEIPLLGPVNTKQSLPKVYESIVPAFLRLAEACTPPGSRDPLEVIQYHGCAKHLSPMGKGQIGMNRLQWELECTFETARILHHSIAIDMASSLGADDSMALAILAWWAAGVRVYMEQRPSREQVYFAKVPTLTMYSELIRQQDRGGEDSLRPFGGDVENILVMDVVPPDRDPMESWDPWIVDQVEALQAEGFTPCVPIHSMVNRNRWDLLEQLFGPPQQAPAGRNAVALEPPEREPPASIKELMAS